MSSATRAKLAGRAAPGRRITLRDYPPHGGAAAGMDGYVTKPIHAADLFAAIEKVVGK